MFDHGLGVLEKYGLTAAGSCRGRGALICQTDQGLKVIREYRGSLEKLKVQRKIQQQAEADGKLKTDLPLLNLEGEAATLHTDGLLYTVRNWYDARECDIRSREEICRGAAALAHLHTVIRLPEGEEYAGYRKESLPDECGRHNREMRRVQHFLQKKQKKNEFERQLLKALDPFLEQGLAVTEELKASGYEELRERALKERYVCHGECTQHNILSAGRQPVFINFERWSCDLPAADLYQFMRKVLEKQDWDPDLGLRIAEAYDRIRPLDRPERENLKLRLAYPWKFWKLVNYYANNPKVWISGKTVEKLGRMEGQREAWLAFLKNLRL